MRRSHFVVAAFTVGLVLAVMPGTSASAAPHPAPVGTLALGTVGGSETSTSINGINAVPGSATNCAAVAKTSPGATGGDLTGCLRIVSVSQSHAAAKSSAAAAAGDTCSRAPSGNSRTERHGFCLKDVLAEYTLFDSRGEVLGTAMLSVNVDMMLNATSTTWTAPVTVSMFDATPTIASLEVSMDVSCGSPCIMDKAEPWAGVTTLANNQSASGTVTFEDVPAGITTRPCTGTGPVTCTPPRGAQNSFGASFQLFAVATGAEPVQPFAIWNTDFNVRCDNQVGGNAGCVFPSVASDLVLSLSQYGAAAATYAFMEQRFIDAWGTEANPLHRLADPAAQKNNRTATCDTPPFVYLDSIVPDDSCDEYPFAATREGGTVGGLCAEIVPQQQADGTWTFFDASPSNPTTFNEPCVRSHVPESENTDAGGALGRLVQADRILDRDAFTVTVVN